MSLNNAGIINKASDAVEKTNIAQVQTLAQLKWSEVYLDENVEKTDEAMSKAVKEKLAAEGINTSEYVIVVTTKGAEVVDGWIQDGLTVKKGDTVLTVGDDITYVYDKTVDGVKDNIKWKILGANDKGELLITSTTEVATLQLEKPGATVRQLQDAWLTAEKDLNDLCAPYIHGKSATDARSIKIEDIDRITGYDKTKSGKGTIYEYDAEVIIKYNGTNKPYYEMSDTVKGDFTHTHDIFYYYDGEKFVEIAPIKGTSGEIITTITNNAYSYPIELVSTTKAYTLINEVSTYWLATTVKVTSKETCAYQINAVSNGGVTVTPLFFANGTIANRNYQLNVRAVVSLSADVQLKGSSESGWSY